MVQEIGQVNHAVANGMHGAHADLPPLTSVGKIIIITGLVVVALAFVAAPYLIGKAVGTLAKWSWNQLGLCSAPVYLWQHNCPITPDTRQLLAKHPTCWVELAQALRGKPNPEVDTCTKLDVAAQMLAAVRDPRPNEAKNLNANSWCEHIEVAQRIKQLIAKYPRHSTLILAKLLQLDINHRGARALDCETQLIVLEMFDKNPQNIAKIAKAIPKIYPNYRELIGNSHMGKANREVIGSHPETTPALCELYHYQPEAITNPVATPDIHRLLREHPHQADGLAKLMQYLTPSSTQLFDHFETWLPKLEIFCHLSEDKIDSFLGAIQQFSYLTHYHDFLEAHYNALFQHAEKITPLFKALTFPSMRALYTKSPDAFKDNVNAVTRNAQYIDAILHDIRECGNLDQAAFNRIIHRAERTPAREDASAMIAALDERMAPVARTMGMDVDRHNISGIMGFGFAFSAEELGIADRNVRQAVDRAMNP